MRSFILFLFVISASPVFARQACFDIFSRQYEENPAIVEGAPRPENASSLDAFLETLSSDYYTKQQLGFIEAALRASKRLNSPVDVSRDANDFRKKVLPTLLYEPNVREALVRYMEADMRMRSELTFEKIRRSPQSYDVMVLGTGVHGVIAVNSLLKKNPGLRILVVDSTDTAGATFRYPNDTFRINSSNRPSGGDSLPLPGRGNINELPNLPVQVSDLTAVKYPTAGDLGTALVTGLYSALSTSPNVDILLRSELTGISREAFVDVRPNPFNISGRKNGENFNVSTQGLILASGLGTPRIPKSVLDSLTAEMVRSANPIKSPPKVMTFETIMRILGQSADPRSIFAGKRVAVVGVGDSANVFIEFLLGYAAEGGYNLSNGQTNGPKKVFWVGQNRETCEDYIADARSRYAQIGTGFRSSDPNGDPIIDAIPEKLDSVKQAEDALRLKLVDSRKRPEVDYVILATGFEGQLFRLFAEQFSAFEAIGRKPALDDKELIARFFSELEDTTVTTGKGETTVGQQARTLTTEPSNVILVGPGAGPLAKPDELFGIIQNTVSIFNNALRTEAASTYLAGLFPKVKDAGDGQYKLSVNLAGNRGSEVVVNKIQDSSPLASGAKVYVESTLAQALQMVTLDQSRGTLKIDFIANGSRIIMRSNYEMKDFAKMLASSRDFFTVLKTLLGHGGNAVNAQALSFSVAVRGYKVDEGAPLNFEFTNVPTKSIKLDGDTPTIPNAQLPLYEIPL